MKRFFHVLAIHLGLARRYEIGCLVFPNGDMPKARRDVLTGEVQFVLWKAGQHGHTKDVWWPVGAGHKFVSASQPY